MSARRSDAEEMSALQRLASLPPAEIRRHIEQEERRQERRDRLRHGARSRLGQLVAMHENLRSEMSCADEEPSDPMLRSRLEAMLASTPHRSLLAMLSEGHTYEEIAQETGEPAGTLRQRVNRLRKSPAVRRLAALFLVSGGVLMVRCWSWEALGLDRQDEPRWILPVSLALAGVAVGVGVEPIRRALRFLAPVMLRAGQSVRHAGAVAIRRLPTLAASAWERRAFIGLGLAAAVVLLGVCGQVGPAFFLAVVLLYGLVISVHEQREREFRASEELLLRELDQLGMWRTSVDASTYTRAGYKSVSHYLHVKLTLRSRPERCEWKGLIQHHVPGAFGIAEASGMVEWRVSLDTGAVKGSMMASTSLLSSPDGAPLYRSAAA